MNFTNFRIKAGNFIAGGIQSPTFNTNDFGLGNVNAVWQNLLSNSEYLEAYSHNPCVNAVINIRADAASNIRFELVDLDDKPIPVDKMNAAQLRVRDLLKQPNVLQAKSEYWKQKNIFRDVFGNSMEYSSFPIGFLKLEDITSLTNVWPQYMKPIATIPKINYFDATNIKDIINYWEFGYNTTKPRKFEPETILHRNDVSIDLKKDGVVLGTSKLKSLSKPISNINIAFESRNVIAKKRGALGIFSGATKDATGTRPLEKAEKKQAQKELNQYGTRENQLQYIITRFPLTFQRTALNVKELQLFEEVAIDTKQIGLAYGVPGDLIILYLQGVTYENQKESVKRLYQDTIIPQADDDVIALSTHLQTEKYGFKIKASFAHIPVLQEDLKERSITNRNQGITYKELFLKNGCTLGEWRNAVGANVDDKYNNKMLLDFSDDELRKLGINVATPVNNAV